MVVMMYISTVTNDAEHLFMCLMAVCISSLEKCSDSFPIFLFFFFLLLKFTYLLIYLFDCAGSYLQQAGSQLWLMVLNLGPLHWEHGILATGSPGKSLYPHF